MLGKGWCGIQVSHGAIPTRPVTIQELVCLRDPDLRSYKPRIVLF